VRLRRFPVLLRLRSWLTIAAGACAFTALDHSVPTGTENASIAVIDLRLVVLQSNPIVSLVLEINATSSPGHLHGREHGSAVPLNQAIVWSL
jgi:hypothetical protein